MERKGQTMVQIIIVVILVLISSYLFWRYYAAGSTLFGWLP